MTDRDRREGRAGLATDDAHYRAFVGPPDRYDLIAALQLNLLTALGMREWHSLLDIGCGSLRFGRLAIPFLRPGKYFGLEPNRWLVQEGVDKECGGDLIRIKEPRFVYDSEFRLTAFGMTFDYLMAHSIFTHAARRQIEQCLAEAARCMAAGSFFVASYARGERDHQGDEWTYPEGVTYREETMLDLAALHGLRCQPMEWEHPGGHSWLLYRLPGSEEADRLLTLPALSGSRGLGNDTSSGELARAGLAAARARNDMLGAKLKTYRTESGALRAGLAEARASNDALRAELATGRAQNDWFRAESARRKAQLRALKKSVSWQITSPLRVLKKWILWLLSRVTSPPP